MIRHAFSTLSLVGISLLSSSALAEQFVLVDVEYTHSAETTSDSHFYPEIPDYVPRDWRSPVDYASGQAHVRLEVLTKPTDAQTRYQICVSTSMNYGCTDQSPVYTETGLVEWITPFDNFWSPGPVNWSEIRSVSLILKDTQNVKPAPENVGAETAARYMPTDLHVVVTIIPPGEDYIPPEDPDLGAGGMGVDAGVVDQGGAPSIEMDPVGGAGGADSVGVVPSAGAAGEPVTTVPVGMPPPASNVAKSDSSCSMSSRSGGTAWLGTAFLLGLCAIRRRR